MYRPPRWDLGQELLRPGGPGGWQRDHHDRRPRERRVAPAAAGVPQRARAAVRILHARNDHGCRRPAAGEPGPERPGDPRGPGGQPLPVHRLREHRPRGTARGRDGGDVGMTAETQAPPVPELGRARLRKEDARLITGMTNWTDNILLPGMLHVAYVRSPFAHAKITRVDVSRALQ